MLPAEKVVDTRDRPYMSGMQSRAYANFSRRPPGENAAGGVGASYNVCEWLKACEIEFYRCVCGRGSLLVVEIE